MATLLASKPSTIHIPMASPTQRRLSTRRGSISAADPYGTHSHLNANPNRLSSSTLTIVRVALPPGSPPAISLHEPPFRRNYPRHGSSSSVGSASPQITRQDSPPSSPSSRLSFAFSSFSGNHNLGPARTNSPPRSESPTNSPRVRPSSPNQSRRPHSRSLSQPHLSPDQLVALIHRPTNP